MAWTPERVERLKLWWSEGKSAVEIANGLGGVSRNAVIGKIHTLGLSGRVTPVKPHYRTNVHVKSYTRVIIERSIKERKAKIYMPPCWRLRRVAEFVFTKKTNSEVFGPLFDDAQHEFNEALQDENARLARWVVLRTYISFFATVIAWVPVSLFDRIRSISKMIGGGG